MHLNKIRINKFLKTGDGFFDPQIPLYEFYYSILKRVAINGILEKRECYRIFSLAHPLSKQYSKLVLETLKRKGLVKIRRDKVILLRCGDRDDD